MPKLLYQGHGSFRLTADDGRVIFVDPYAGEGYDKLADFILVTHQHHDHNKTDIVAKKLDCKIISNFEAIQNGVHQKFEFDEIAIEAVAAKNLMHNPKDCVGYIITIDRVKIYAMGDTSETEQMKTFAERQLNYALFPIGGPFMNLKGSARCAEIIGAKHNIPIHMSPGKLFDRAKAEKWNAPNKLVVEAGEEINLQ